MQEVNEEVSCPLFNKDICIGLCQDIFMLANGMIHKDDIGEVTRFDISTIKEKCLNCKNL